MRSRNRHTVSSVSVHRWALNGLLDAKLLKDHGYKCTAATVFEIVLRAAANLTSIFAACRDLIHAPSSQAVYNALEDGLPRTLPVLERRLNEALAAFLPGRRCRRSWDVAIDWHLVPYYGEPDKSRNEIYWGKPRQGTTKFHAYATACVVVYGRRYTLALTWVRRHDTLVSALTRLLDRIDVLGVKIRCLLLDAAFDNVPVVLFLQARRQPFLMPAVIRGRKPKKGKRAIGLRAIRRRGAGWHQHTMKSRGQTANVKICVAYRTGKHRQTGRRSAKTLLFVAWRVSGSPTEIRRRYRRRFGIETSYRQMRQARIATCSRNPHLRLMFVAVALLLRNLWVWLHEEFLAEGSGDGLTLHLERLRFKRLLSWIGLITTLRLHDGSRPCVDPHA